MVGRETRRGSKVWCKSTTADVGVVADGGGERRDVGQKSNVVKEHHGRCGEERRDVSLKSSVV